jgi:hypothetical protein
MFRDDVVSKTRKALGLRRKEGAIIAPAVDQHDRLRPALRAAPGQLFVLSLLI